MGCHGRLGCIMAKNPGRGNKGSRKNSIPNVVGQAKTTAESNLTNAGFVYNTTDENTTDNNLNNTIKSQDITAGDVKPIGTTVSLVNYTFSFTPFGAFGFTPFGAFGFTPFGFTPFGFTPFGFTPVFTFSPPSCVHEDTLIDTKNGKVKAKDIQIGDEIISVSFNEIPDASIDGGGDFDYVGFISQTLTSKEKTLTTVIDIVPSIKNTLLYFNGDSSSLFSTTQPFFIKRNSYYEIVPSGAIEIGDYLISIDEDGLLIENEILNIDYLTQDATVYQFGCEPQDWFVAGNYLVHNK
jgi:hypothetical protein